MAPRSPARLAAPFLLLALAGCGLGRPPEPLYPDGRPALAQAQAIHAVRFPNGLSVLGGSEQAELLTFLGRAGAGDGDRVTLLVSPDLDMVETRRRVAVEDLLYAQGLRVAVVGDPEPRPGVMRVAVDRTVALTPGCPDWTADPLKGWRNRTSPGFGCASAANLAEMTARPADLARGDDPGPARLPEPARGRGGASGAAASGPGGAGPVSAAPGGAAASAPGGR